MRTAAPRVAPVARPSTGRSFISRYCSLTHKPHAALHDSYFSAALFCLLIRHLSGMSTSIFESFMQFYAQPTYCNVHAFCWSFYYTGPRPTAVKHPQHVSLSLKQEYHSCSEPNFDPPPSARPLATGYTGMRCSFACM